MGKVQQGILDGFVGKVGTVVGSFWKGKPVMRGYKRIVRDANTEKQELIRTRFSAIGALASSFYEAILLGFKGVARAKKITEGDYFVKVNWDYVHADSPGSATVDYTDLTIAKGNLPEIRFGNASFTTPNSVVVAISDPADQPGSLGSDIAHVFVYSPEAAAGILSSPKTREDSEITVAVPDYWAGQRVHVYGFGMGDPDGDNAGRTTDSRYIGSGTIN